MILYFVVYSACTTACSCRNSAIRAIVVFLIKIRGVYQMPYLTYGACETMPIPVTPACKSVVIITGPSVLSLELPCPRISCGRLSQRNFEEILACFPNSDCVGNIHGRVPQELRRVSTVLLIQTVRGFSLSTVSDVLVSIFS